MFIMSICSFALINAAPGEPAAAIYGGQMDKLTQAEKDRINEESGTESASHNKVWTTGWQKCLTVILDIRMQTGKMLER